jgi:3-methyladenine DNA glycosylase/8-oxoguanine DNA glycosylase
MELGSIEIVGRLDLRRTLAPLGGYFRPDGWWRPMRTPDGPATVQLRRSGSRVEARAFGPGAAWGLGLVAGFCGSEDDPTSLVTDHPVISPLARQHSGWRFARTGLVFEALLNAIVAQKVTGKEAARSGRALIRRFSESAPGPEELPLTPDPERLAGAPYYEYHPLGIEQRRADTIRRAAGDAVRIDHLVSVPTAEARKYLERLAGIGEWTSAETVAISHGDTDAVSVGDFHLKHVVVWHLTGRPRGTDDEMLALLEPFRPHRGRVVRLLETLGHEPAFGPRQPLRSIAGN